MHAKDQVHPGDEGWKIRLDMDATRIQFQSLLTADGPPASSMKQRTSVFVFMLLLAKVITFTPAMKDGKPVSMWIQLEYNFNQ